MARPRAVPNKYIYNDDSAKVVISGRFSVEAGAARGAGWSGADAPLGRGLVGSVLGAAQLLQVVALDGFVQRELRQRLVHGEPLALAAHQPRVFPLCQFLRHRHHVHLRAVLVLAVL